MTFVERTGADAAPLLTDLARRLARHGQPSRLLVGTDDPDRFLLVVEGEPRLFAEERNGARVWRFRDARPAAAGGAA